MTLYLISGVFLCIGFVSLARLLWGLLKRVEQLERENQAMRIAMTEDEYAEYLRRYKSLVA